MFLHVKLLHLRVDGIIPSPNNILALKLESESKKMRATDLLKSRHTKLRYKHCGNLRLRFTAPSYQLSTTVSVL